MKNKIFSKCPICGENAVVEPKLGTKDYRVFKCDNGHLFKKKRNSISEQEKEEVLGHLPGWAGALKGISKGKLPESEVERFYHNRQ